jgi:hypothetical protein
VLRGNARSINARFQGADRARDPSEAATGAASGVGAAMSWPKECPVFAMLDDDDPDAAIGIFEGHGQFVTEPDGTIDLIGREPAYGFDNSGIWPVSLLHPLTPAAREMLKLVLR